VGILAWDQATKLVKLDMQIERLESLLSALDIREGARGTGPNLLQFYSAAV